jgi:D-xylose transport system substrate-binding protein
MVGTRHAGVRAFALLLCLVFVAAACQSPALPSPSLLGAASGAAPTPSRAATRTPRPTTSATPASTAGVGCKIGVAWNKATDDRVRGWYEPAVKSAIEAAGAQYLTRDANASADTQSKQVQELVDAGSDVLIVLPQDPAGVKPAIARTVAGGVPVVALDRAILDPKVLFVGTDQVQAGAMQASALLGYWGIGRPSLVRFIVVKGDANDLESKLLRQGMAQVGLPEPGQTSSTLVNVGEANVPGWDPDLAEVETEKLLLAAGKNVHLILVESDGLADGVYRALDKLGIDVSPVPPALPPVLIGGRGGEPSGLNRVARGTQIVDLWENLPVVGKLAGEAALALCANHRIDEVTTSAGRPRALTVPNGGPAIPAVLLNPVEISYWNMEVVLDAHWISLDVLCKGVGPETYVDACKH